MGSMRNLVSRALALCPALFALTASASDLPLFADSVELEDAIGLSVLDREIVAYDVAGGASPVLRLERNERVVWTGAKGRVAILLTDRRGLARSADVGGWHDRAVSVHHRQILSGCAPVHGQSRFQQQGSPAGTGPPSPAREVLIPKVHTHPSWIGPAS